MGLSQGSLLLSELIKRGYSRKVVEVGCGKYSHMALILSQSFIVIATDILDNDAVDERIKRLYAKDDVTSADLRLYKDAQLLYSIRPPLEIQPSILDVADAVHADVLIKPLGDEIIESLRVYLKNYHRLAFYHVRKNKPL